MIKCGGSWFILVMICVGNVFASSEFKEHNPDGQKYEFARSYITALSYLDKIDTRWDKNPPKKKFAADELAMIRGNINYLIKDNADLRIAKNYLLKYLSSSNALIRKTSDMVVIKCDKGISVNDQEKILWQQWLELKTTGQATPARERTFVLSQEQLAHKRKEIDKTLIEATILMTHVIKSMSNSNEKGTKLAITRSQREKLGNKLDSFAHHNLDWGLKPGQKTLAACIAVIREILEDPLWIASNG